MTLVLFENRKNFLKEKIQSGKPVIGTWNTIGSPMLAEVLAKSGFDFLIIDFEHGPFQLEKISQYVNACERYQCSPIIRIPSNSDWISLQALDQGAHGVIVPGVSDYKSANEFVQSIKFHPLGKRGFTPFSKAGGFTNKDNASFPKNANDFTLSSVILETAKSLNNLDEILKISELDIIYFGAYDLSQSLGYPGDTKNEKVTSSIEKSVKKVISAGKIAGGFVPQNKDEISWLLEIGIKFITYNVDSDIIFKSSNEITSWFNKIK